MKVLVVDEWLPWPLDSGKKIRTFNLLKRLAQWHEIVLLGFADPSNDEEKIKRLEAVNIRVWPVEDIRIPKWSFKFYLCVVANFFSNNAFSTTYHITSEFRLAVRNAIANVKPDMVHCEWTNLSPVLEDVKGVPRVISSHNIESQIWERFGQSGINIFHRILGRNQARKIEALERKWYPLADRCIAVSSDDEKVIKGYGGRPVLVDNGVDLDYYNLPCYAIEAKALVFTASFDTFSNQDAVDYFLKDIFPIIKASDPAIKLWLVGKDPPSRIVRYAESDSNIIVTGTVPDVREYVSKADICIVPIRIGGGSRLKILEALAMRKPVISTSVGAEGLRVENQKHIVLADNPMQFAREVLDLLNDPQRKRRLGENGFNLVQKEYDWDLLSRRLATVWESLKSPVA